MKFTWLSSKSLLFAAYIFECIFGSIKCNLRYILHQIQLNKYDEAEYQIGTMFYFQLGLYFAFT